MMRDVLLAVCIALLVMIPLALKRKPDQMACASDTYAKAIMLVRNIGRQGRGQQKVSCSVGDKGLLRHDWSNPLVRYTQSWHLS